METFGPQARCLTQDGPTTSPFWKGHGAWSGQSFEADERPAFWVWRGMTWACLKMRWCPYMRKNDKPPPAAPNTLSQSIWSTRAYRNYWFQIWNKSRTSTAKRLKTSLTRAKVGNSWARIPAGRWRKPWTLIRRFSRPIWQTYPRARYEPSQISNCVGRHLSSRRVMAYGNLKDPRNTPRMAPEIWWVNVDFQVWYPRVFFYVFLIRRSPLSQLVVSSWNENPNQLGNYCSAP